MFNSPILDIAVILIFIYFVFSLTVSAFNEFIFTLLSIRSKMLKRSILELLPNDSKWVSFANEMIKSPIIQLIQSRPNSENFPSYISPEVFAQAFMSSLPLQLPEKGPFTVENIQKAINSAFDDPKTQKMFALIINDARNDFQKLQTSLANIFDEAMDRLTGVFKRWSQLTIFIISFIVALSYNIDTIQISKYLWNNSSISKSTADQIHNMVTDSSLAKFMAKDKNAVKDSTIEGQITAKIKAIKMTDSLYQTTIVNKMQLPIGWDNENYPVSCNFISWLSKIFGLIITATAVSLGAPFWFDILNKIVNIRGAGIKPKDESDNNKDKNQKNDK